MRATLRDACLQVAVRQTSFARAQLCPGATRHARQLRRVKCIVFANMSHCCMTYGLLVKQSVSTADDNATHAVMAAKVDVSNADLMGVLGGEPARLLELDLGHHAGLQVGDAHDPSVLNVHLAHDQIVDGRCHLQRSRHASACQVDRCALSRTSTTQFIEHFSCSVYQFDGVKMSTNPPAVHFCILQTDMLPRTTHPQLPTAHWVTPSCPSTTEMTMSCVSSCVRHIRE